MILGQVELVRLFETLYIRFRLLSPKRLMDIQGTTLLVTLLVRLPFRSLLHPRQLL
jgi:hypothetical protein